MFQHEISNDSELQILINKYGVSGWKEIANYKVVDNNTYKRLLSEVLIIISRFDSKENKYELSRTDKKQIKKEIKENEKNIFLNSLPMPVKIFQKLFDFLDTKSETRTCNHTLSLTVEFLRNKKIEEEPVIKWFNEHGAFCDCEIIFNIEQLFEN